MSEFSSATLGVVSPTIRWWLGQSGLNQPGPLQIHVRFQDGSAKASYPLQDRFHVAFTIQDKESRCSWRHQNSHFTDESVVDSDFRCGAASASHQGTDRCSTERWSTQRQPCEEPGKGATEVDSGHERLPIERER